MLFTVELQNQVNHCCEHKDVSLILRNKNAKTATTANSPITANKPYTGNRKWGNKPQDDATKSSICVCVRARCILQRLSYKSDIKEVIIVYQRK